jgi:hypothetical protein
LLGNFRNDGIFVTRLALSIFEGKKGWIYAPAQCERKDEADRRRDHQKQGLDHGLDPQRSGKDSQILVKILDARAG